MEELPLPPDFTWSFGDGAYFYNQLQDTQENVTAKKRRHFVLAYLTQYEWGDLSLTTEGIEKESSGMNIKTDSK